MLDAGAGQSSESDDIEHAVVYVARRRARRASNAAASRSTSRNVCTDRLVTPREIAHVCPFFSIIRHRVRLRVVTIATSVRADENPPPADPSRLPVFKQFGDKPGLVALMDDSMIQLVRDPRTRPFFADTDQKHIKDGTGRPVLRDRRRTVKVHRQGHEKDA